MTNDYREEGRVDERDRQTGAILRLQLEGLYRDKHWYLASIKAINKGDSWLFVVQREWRNGDLEVAFVNAKALDTGYRTLYSLLYQDRLKWRKPRVWPS